VPLGLVSLLSVLSSFVFIGRVAGDSGSGALTANARECRPDVVFI